MDFTDLIAQFDLCDRADRVIHRATGDYVCIEWERLPGGPTGGDVERELARVGVDICGRWFSPASEEYPHGTLSCLVRGGQARWAEYAATAAGVAFVSKPIDARSVAAAMARQGRRIPAWSEQVRRYENKASRAGWVERLRGLLEELWG